MKKFLALSLFLTALHAHALDIYIGTLEAKNGQVILTRCDLAQNRYILLDENNNSKTPVQKLRKKIERETDPIYGEVIGEYRQKKDGENLLLVKSIENIRKNNSCHLLDAL